MAKFEIRKLLGEIVYILQHKSVEKYCLVESSKILITQIIMKSRISLYFSVSPKFI